MAFASQKAGGVIAFALVAAGALRGEIHFDARHDHVRKGCNGVMTVDDSGIYFRGAKNHAWAWKYQDIQELKLGADRIHLLTYWDNPLRLGSDREYDFTGKIPVELYALWKDKLDQRFVAEIADADFKPLWRIPVKRVRRISGSEGMLEVGEDRIVYDSDRKAESRTWRFADIENISSPGPFEMTITTFERARFHYGDRKDFNFQLKEVLPEGRYNDLWRRLNNRRKP
jgi:hypothetical protein